MCLLFVALEQHPDWPLIVAANRDELHRRPARAAQRWPEQPQWLGGRDLDAGGSWLLLSEAGRLAAVTNVRQGEARSWPKSRGRLVTDFLAFPGSAAEFSRQQAAQAADYGGFNLLAGQCVRTGAGRARWQLHLCSNRGPWDLPVAEGVHGLSNGRWNEPWPKVAGGQQALDALLRGRPGQEALETGLLALLADRQPAAVAQLPDTGVGRARELLLSSRFILSRDYGTRASTLLLADPGGHCLLLERRFDAEGRYSGESRLCAQM